MRTTEYIWKNGKFIPWAEATTHVLTHSLHYGASAFEGMRSYLTKSGPVIFRLNEHIERFFYSASVIDMVLPYSQKELGEASQELVSINKLQECYIRPLAYYGYGKMGVNPNGAPIEVAIACWPWDDYSHHEIITMKTNKYIRIPPSVAVPNAKISGNYLNSILGILELKGSAYNEPLFLDADGYIAEGASANFFLVKDNVVYTPKLGSILPGITRETVIEIVKKLNLVVLEKDLTLEEAYNSDEAFLTGTAIEVMPIKSIDDQAIGNNEIGPITKKIKDIFFNVVRNNL